MRSWLRDYTAGVGRGSAYSIVLVGPDMTREILPSMMRSFSRMPRISCASIMPPTLTRQDPR